MIQKTRNTLVKGFIEAGKLKFAGGFFAKSALAKSDAIAWSLADLVKQDRGEALLLINNTLDAMDKAGVVGEPRRIVKVSLQRAITVLHDGTVKVKISERPERAVSIADVAIEVDWLAANKSLFKRLEKVMSDHGLTFYDVAGAVAVSTEKDIEKVGAVKAADEAKALAAETVKTYEHGVMAELMAANG